MMPMEIHEDKIIMRAGTYNLPKPWVGLTDVERLGIRARVQEYTRIDSVKYGEAIQIATEEALREKNHGT